MAKEKTVLEKLEDSLSQYKLQREAPTNISVIPTGFDSFDNDILGIGGVPLRRVVQLYGPMSCGKTLTALRIMAMAQRQFPDKAVALLDTEFTFDEEWARQNGVDTDRVFYRRSNRLEEVFEYAIRLAESKMVSLIVLDSLGNLVIDDSLNTIQSYKKSSKGEYDYREQPGVVAKKVTLFMRQIVGLLHQNDISLVVCNQIRQKIGVLYGDPTDFPGGENFRHNLTMNIQLRNVEPIEENGSTVGVTIGARVKKNKLFYLASTDESNHMRFYFENGIEKTKIYSLYDRAVRAGVITSSGPWCYVRNEDGEVIDKIQGRTRVIGRIMEDYEFRERVDQLCAKADARPVYVPPFEEPDDTVVSDE